MGDTWVLYAERKPEAAGVYQWRVPSVRVPGLVVTFFAHMQKRGAGYTDVLSPVFDHWDGYRVHVPKDTEWREAVDAPPTKQHEATGLAAETVDLDPCPFCREPPRLCALERGVSGGVAISTDPHRYNRWWAECCAWVRTPCFDDPRKLANEWNGRIRAALTAEPTP